MPKYYVIFSVRVTLPKVSSATELAKDAYWGIATGQHNKVDLPESCFTNKGNNEKSQSHNRIHTKCPNPTKIGTPPVSSESSQNHVG